MIIRIHNTGDPYKLPTLSVHIYIYIYIGEEASSSFSSRAFLFFLSLSPSLYSLPFQPPSLPTCRGNNHSARFTGLCPSSFPLLLLPSPMREEDTSRALSLSYSFLHPVNIATLPCYLPTPRSDAPVQWLFFFFTLDT